ncbi:FAD dependent oxidoreductase, partial [Xylariales sp. PMI_506]
LGGGVIGCVTAYYLTRHPSFNPSIHHITILEASSIAAGASGKAGGLLGLWAYPHCIVPLSYQLHAELAAEHGGSERWGYRKLGCGQLTATVKTRHLTGEGGALPKVWKKLPKQDAAASSLLKNSKLPADLDWIDAGLVQKYDQMGMPGQTETAQVHPHQFTLEIARLAQERGVHIRLNAKATAIRLGAGRTSVDSVEYLDRATGQASAILGVTDVVVAAGPWSGALVPSSSVGGIRAHSVVFRADVSPYAVFTNISLPRDWVPAHRAAAGQRRSTHRGRVDPEVYARPNGEAYACGEPDPSALPLPDTADLVECDDAQCDDLAAYLGTVSPVLGPAAVSARQACYIPRHMRGDEEMSPLVGPTLAGGLWMAAGHTCWGIQNGPGTGKLISEFIFDGAARSADISELDPRLFNIGI